MPIPYTIMDPHYTDLCRRMHGTITNDGCCLDTACVTFIKPPREWKYPWVLTFDQTVGKYRTWISLLIGAVFGFACALLFWIGSWQGINVMLGVFLFTIFFFRGQRVSKPYWYAAMTCVLITVSVLVPQAVIFVIDGTYAWNEYFDIMGHFTVGSFSIVSGRRSVLQHRPGAFLPLPCSVNFFMKG